MQSFEKKGYWMAPKMLEDEDIELLRKVPHPLPPQKKIIKLICLLVQMQEANRVFEGKVDRGSTPYEYEYWKRVVAKHQQGLPDVLYVHPLRQITLVIGQLVVLMCGVMCPQEGEQFVVGERRGEESCSLACHRRGGRKAAQNQRDQAVA